MSQRSLRSSYHRHDHDSEETPGIDGDCRLSTKLYQRLDVSEDDVKMEPDDCLETTTAEECYLSNSQIQSKILSGDYQISQKRGRSNVWNIFGRIQNEMGKFLNVVTCRICSNIYSYSSKSTSNLVKHKCYIHAMKDVVRTKADTDNENVIRTEVDTEIKEDIEFTEYKIGNSRPFKIVKISADKNVAETLADAASNKKLSDGSDDEDKVESEDFLETRTAASTEECNLSNSQIKSKILSGEYKIINKTGRSRVWNVFAKIEDEMGKVLSVVFCRSCSNLYKYNSKSTSNLVKHKCYILPTKDNENAVRTKVDTASKGDIVVTEWTVEDGRPFEIVEVSGLKKEAETFDCATYDPDNRSSDVSEDEDKVEPEESVETTAAEESYLSNSQIKSKILSGEYQISIKEGRSNVWNVFAKIKNEMGNDVGHVVSCRICSNIYSYSSKSTSNLVKHKCYILSTKDNDSRTRMEVDAETKKAVVRMFTEWTIENCRPIKMVEDSGLKQMAEIFISIGAKYGKYVDLNSVLPHPTTISRNIEKVYQFHLQEIRTEISLIKHHGFGLTSDLWTDNYLRKRFIAVTIHYVKEGKLVTRLLGIKSMEGKKCTDKNIVARVKHLLNEFECNLEENGIIVTDRSSNMIAAFRQYNRIYCIKHLIHNTLQKATVAVTAVDDLCRSCSDLVKYFKNSGLNSTLRTKPKSFSPTRWNKTYFLLISVQKNWAKIVQMLQHKKQMHRIHNINFNEVSDIVQLLEHFEETFNILHGEKNATLHLVIIYIHSLKKKCAIQSKDLPIVQEFKEKLRILLEDMVMKNLTIFHRIALFLFPPANKLMQFNEHDKQCIKSELKRIIEYYIAQESDTECMPSISNYKVDVFSDFISPHENLNGIDKINREIEKYESVNTPLHDEFNVLLWWDQHKIEFPYLYKASCKILATPASNASSENMFSLARHMISDKRCTIASNDKSINEIMFLHANIEKDELEKELVKY